MAGTQLEDTVAVVLQRTKRTVNFLSVPVSASGDPITQIQTQASCMYLSLTYHSDTHERQGQLCCILLMILSLTTLHGFSSMRSGCTSTGPICFNLYNAAAPA